MAAAPSPGGTRLLVLEFADAVAGYVSYGRNRVPALDFGGEIFELYLAPECQGCGFGRRMFEAARKDLAGHGYGTLCRLGARRQRAGARLLSPAWRTRSCGARTRHFGGQTRERIAFGFG